ncbi:hypothetical protein [Streptosporangium roseum]|uniref:Secreted protein n=1 Tax=Streptosporangium roseum (strain ATCC 12428 / DSM 43021 / JCM 3005 / KCTC 9067 / NCIMB 10171 / NRRL 2505 / NI 9100) TaxID=479432 RepID=D2ASV2_STRRD|nr:hypothetical protein [Streptosporangium roseum]ACZ90429.1 hypothetical protein Sros_7761 [Streptosporangium roseum DSM 43021]
MKPLKKIAAVIGAAGIVAGGVLVAAPAQAAGSVIDIGYTIVDGRYIKGSGSMTNNGDYTNVCVVIMGKKNSSGYSDYTMACRTNRGSVSWSAPDVFAGNLEARACYEFYTRISAYKNGTRVANKNSNHVKVGTCG